MADLIVPNSLAPNPYVAPPVAPEPPVAPARDFTPVVSEDPSAPETVQYLVDKVHNKPIQVPNSQVAPMVLTGDYELPGTGKQYALTPEGEMIQVDNAKYVDALRDGVVLPASDADVRKAIYEGRYGNSEFTAAAAGALRGLTLGTSDLALTTLKPSLKGTLAGLQEANPISSTLGEVGGTGASLFIPVGPVAAATKAGMLAERAAVKMLAKGGVEAGLSKGVVRSILEKVVPTAVGSGVEGIFYGTGGLISESALGKADFNAENLAASAGVGALFGAGVGAGFAALKQADPVVKDTGLKIAEKYTDKSEALREFLGVKVKKWDLNNKINKNYVNQVDDVLTNPNKVGMGVLESIETVSKKVDNFLENANTRIDDSLSAIREMSAKDASILPDAKEFYGNLAKTSDDLAKKLEVRPGEITPEVKTHYNTFKTFASDYAKLAEKSIPGEKVSIDTLQQIRKTLDKSSNWEKFAPDSGTPLISRELRSVIRKDIDVLAEKVAPEVGKALKEANLDYHITKGFRDDLAAKAGKGASFGWKDAMFAGVSHMLSGAPEITAALVAGKKLLESDLRRKMVILGTVERSNMAINKVLNTSTAKFFTEAASAGAKAARINANTRLVDFPLSRSEDGKKPANIAQAYSNLQQNLNHYATEPEKLLQKVQQSSVEVASAAPDTAAALSMTGNNAINFLNSKLPRKTGNPTMLGRPYSPSGTELAKFERYLTAIEKPTEVLKNFADGKMSREESEALKAVYPNIFGRLQEQALAYVGENPQLPYNKKLQLGILLDIPTDPSLAPMNILGLQSNFSQQPQDEGQPQPAVKTSQSGLKNLSFSDRINGEQGE